MRKAVSRSPPAANANSPGPDGPVTTSNPYITSVLRRSSQMSQNSPQRRSISNKKAFDEMREQEEIEASQRIEGEANKSMQQPKMGRGFMGNAFDEKRGSASAAATKKQYQAKSATGGPDHFDDKSGSRIPSHDDMTSKNSGVQKQSQGNSRSRQSRQSRQSAAKDRKAHLTERIKGAAGTGASSSLNGNFAKEKRRVLPHTDSMMKVGPSLPQRNGDDQKVAQDEAVAQERIEHGPFKMNQFQLDDTPPPDEIGQRPQTHAINHSLGQNGFGTADVRGKALRSEFETQEAESYQDNANSVVTAEGPKKVNDLQIDPNPFARRDKSRQSNQRTGRDRRPRMRSGVYDDSSSNQMSKTPSLPHNELHGEEQESFTDPSKPTYQVEADEHNITNISLNVSHMNLTAEAEVIEELDEETFRPNNNRNHEEQLKQSQSLSQTYGGKQRAGGGYAGRQEVNADFMKSKQLTKLNSGRTRQNKAIHGSSQQPTTQSSKPAATRNFATKSSPGHNMNHTTRSAAPGEQRYGKTKPSVTTAGPSSPTKDLHVVYRAVDENRRLIDGGRASDPTKGRRHDAEFSSTSPSKIESLMKPVRQQSAMHASNKPLSPTKSQKLRHSYVQANAKEHRATPGLNDVAGSLHTQSVASSTHGGQQQKAVDQGANAGQSLLEKYQSHQHFTSASHGKPYRASDERNKKGNYSVGSVNDTVHIADGEALAEIEEEKAQKEHGRSQTKDMSPGKINTAPSRQSKHGVNEEPEAEAKTQVPHHQKHAEGEARHQFVHERPRKSTGLAATSTSGMYTSKSGFLARGSPRFSGEKRTQVSPLLNNCTSSQKRNLNRYGSQSSMQNNTNQKKDDQQRVANQGQSAVAGKARVPGQRQSHERLANRRTDDANQSFISQQSEKQKTAGKDDLSYKGGARPTQPSRQEHKPTQQYSPTNKSRLGQPINEREIELDNLRTIIVALNQKVKARDDVEKQFKELRKHQAAVVEGRDELRMQIEENVHSFKEQQMKNQKFQELIIEENKNWNLVDQEKDQIISAKDNEIRELRALLNQKDRHMQEMQLQREEMAAALHQNKKIDSFYSQIKVQRSQQQSEMDDIFEQHNSQLQKEYEERQLLIKEKQEMQEQIRLLREENDRLMVQNDQYKLDADQQKNLVMMQENQAKAMRESEGYFAALETHLNEEKEQREVLLEKMKGIQRESEDLRNDDHQNFQAIQAEMARINQEKEEAIQQSADKDIKIKNLMQTNLDLQAKLNSLNQLVAIKDDLSDQLDQLNNYVEEIMAQKKTMQRELETAGDYLLEQEEKTNKANMTALDLLNKLKEADEEIDYLKRLINILKSQTAQYVPVQGDATDEALADYINNFHDKSKLQVMFIRLNPGIYQFGSKKICIRVEQGKINIRVGGGYLYIDDFLDQYTTLELEKAMRDGTDPMGGDSSPMKVPGLPSGGKSPAAAGRSTSPKKLLHKVSAAPVPGTNQAQWKPQNVSPRKTDRMFTGGHHYQ